MLTTVSSNLLKNRSELHASPHIHIWIKAFHMWIHIDKTIRKRVRCVG